MLASHNEHRSQCRLNDRGRRIEQICLERGRLRKTAQKSKSRIEFGKVIRFRIWLVSKRLACKQKTDLRLKDQKPNKLMHDRSAGWQCHFAAETSPKKTTRQGNPRRVVCRSRLKGNQSVFATLFSERKQHWPERRDACWSLEHLGQQPVLALEQLP